MNILLNCPSRASFEAAVQSEEWPEISQKNEWIYEASSRNGKHRIFIVFGSGWGPAALVRWTKLRQENTFHLCLQISSGLWLKEDPFSGWLNVINEKCLSGHQESATEVQWYAEPGDPETASAPFVRGGLVNMSNAYMDYFGTFRKVAGASGGTAAWAKECAEKRKFHVFTPTGADFAYFCLSHSLPYYHLAYVSEQEGSERTEINDLLQKMLQLI